MARPRHAMRVHPLRSKGVVVGVPVAAAVAFGAHSVLGVTPLSDQQDVPASAAAPSAAPLQSYGLAATPPPTTLDLLSAPGDETPASAPTADASSSPATRADTTTTKIAGGRATGASAAPTAQAETLPIAAPAAAPAPSMMTFSGGDAPQARTAAAAPQRSAPQEQVASQPQAAEDDGGSQRSSGGALLGLDLGVAKVSVLSFGG
ncbi:hypothetical protein [Actinomycetospora soli]|uniref:hypothetical protein n=1 Tax=Actinomycetospora soli TaxID=2893887 RepID=UPI001E494117|nr:hypothetical protein [Actinomycetospora soli]MCD2188719.1 hypothetical protein [Actinomycetospora soli]